MKIAKVYGLVGAFSAFAYFSIAIFLLNPSLVFQTLWSSSTILSKLSLLLALLESSWSALSPIDFSLLVFTSLLVGINVALSLKLLKRLKNMGGVTISLGGGTVAGIFSAGCAACGFSALSLFGLSGTVAYIPFQGVGLYVVAISLLLFTLYYNIKHLQKPLICKNPNESSDRVRGKKLRHK